MLRDAYDAVKVPLFGIFAIILITFLAFVFVKPETFRAGTEWSITGNTVADSSFFDASISVAAPCAPLDDPVCGTDGVTYLNLCEAKRGGVDMRHRGGCDSWVRE